MCAQVSALAKKSVIAPENDQMTDILSSDCVVGFGPETPAVSWCTTGEL